MTLLKKQTSITAGPDKPSEKTFLHWYPVRLFSVLYLFDMISQRKDQRNLLCFLSLLSWNTDT